MRADRNDDGKALGVILRAARIAKGLTQQALADRLQIESQRIHTYEKGHFPSAQSLINLCKVLDLDARTFPVMTEKTRKKRG